MRGRIGLVPAFVLIVVALIVLVVLIPSEPEKEAPYVDPLAPFVKADITWSASDLDQFLLACDSERLASLEAALTVESTIPADDFEGKAGEIKKEFVWHSSNILAYPFKDTDEVDYHSVVQWVAKKHGVDSRFIDSDPTFILERRVLEKVFVQLWDGLTPEQRQELIAKIDPENKLSGVEVANLGGTAALAALAGTTYLSGFAFYTTMSTVIATVAGWAGVTLPIGVYTGASATVAFLTGPVGWVLIGIGATALMGRADLKETTAFVLQMHSLKVVALERSHWAIPEPER
jgi:uncharacterized protein YaaW (UPF0174 family)